MLLGTFPLLGWLILAPPGQPSPVRPDSTCAADTAAAARALDFWIGTWRATSNTAGHEQAGTDRITPILGGCALREEWTGAAGDTGEGTFFFDPAAGRWRM